MKRLPSAELPATGHSRRSFRPNSGLTDVITLDILYISEMEVYAMINNAPLNYWFLL